MPNSNNIPFFHEAYYRSRKILGLFSGLLICWEILGGKVAEEGKAIIPAINITFPTDIYENGIPLVLFFGVLFYLLRYLIEWNQADKARKQMLASKVDKAFTLIIACFSITVFTLNIIFDFKIYEYWRLVFFLFLFSIFLMSDYKTFLIPWNFFAKGQGDRNKAFTILKRMVSIIVLSIILGIVFHLFPEAFAGGGPGDDPTGGDPPP